MMFNDEVISVDEKATMVDEKLREFQSWLRDQPDLPQKIEPLLLHRYLKTYEYDLKRAQSLLRYSLTLRTKNKHIFTNRDFLSPEIQSIFNCCEMVPLMKVTEKNYKSCIYRLIDYNSANFTFNDAVKAFFMVADVRMISNDPDPDNLSDGECPIFDMTGATIWHVLKVTFSTLRLYFRYTQEAHPIRAKTIHVVNCSPLINRIMALIRPLLKPEVAERFQFHQPDSDTLFDFFPIEMLPEEYGGTGGPISAMKKYWTELFMKNRFYIKNDNNWMMNDKIDELNNNDNYDESLG